MKKFFHLEAEIQKIKDKDISIEVHNDVLTIKSPKENDTETEKEKENYHIREFSSQSFERSFKLSNRVDNEKASAKIENGLLKIDLPKHEQIKPEIIEVQSN